MNIIEATRGYEQWVRGEVGLVEADLKRKHARMVDGAFPFLRATYYRWAQVWEAAAGDLARTPKVLSVGDLHIENFGTWRDAEGRLVWGVNDFDEAAVLPLASDLLRLSVSAVLAVGEHELRISRAEPPEGRRTILEEASRVARLQGEAAEAGRSSARAVTSPRHRVGAHRASDRWPGQPGSPAIHGDR